MDNNDGNPSHAKEPAMDAGDWKSQLQANSRERIIDKIMETLKRHLPYSGQDGLAELKKIAVRFEEKMYDAATSQYDYLRKISLKMLTMESRSQNTMANSSESNSAGSSGMQPQVTNEGQLSSENIQSNILPAGVENSAALSSALPPTFDSRRPPQVQECSLDMPDWRSVFQPDARRRIVNKIIDLLNKSTSHSRMGLPELERIAVTFEEKIYAVASSQSDYLRKLSLKMLVWETKPRAPSNLKRHRDLAFGTDE